MGVIPVEQLRCDLVLLIAVEALRAYHKLLPIIRVDQALLRVHTRAYLPLQLDLCVRERYRAELEGHEGPCGYLLRESSDVSLWQQVDPGDLDGR